MDKWRCVPQGHMVRDCLVTVEPLPGAHPLGGHADPHGAADVARLLAAVGQVRVELLRRAADH